MLMTPPPGYSPPASPTGPNRQATQLLGAPSRLGGAVTSQRPLGTGLTGNVPGISANPMGLAQQQQMMLARLLRGQG